MNVADDNWEMAGQLNMNRTDIVGPTLSGDMITISGDVSVGGSGPSRISAAVTMTGTPTVNVGAGATLQFTGAGLATGDVAFTGAGTILSQPDADNTTFGTLTVNMPAGRFDLDGNTSGDDRLQLAGVLTLNVGSVDSDANTFENDEIEIGGFGRLVVNLPGSDSWIMDGLLDLNGLGGAVTSFHLDGADVELRGTTDVTGNSTQLARIDITGQVNVAAGGSLNIRGGDFASPDTIAGGTISGPGNVGAVGGDALVGFGIIGASIEFAGSSRLLAQDGTLTLSGPINDVGRIGTASDTGVLDVTSNWNTNVSQEVRLADGTIEGGYHQQRPQRHPGPRAGDRECRQQHAAHCGCRRVAHLRQSAERLGRRRQHGCASGRQQHT